MAETKPPVIMPDTQLTRYCASMFCVDDGCLSHDYSFSSTV